MSAIADPDLVAQAAKKANARPHPAKFSTEILDVLRPLMERLPGPILDPFAGTGRIHELGRTDTIGVEIEPEWAEQHERTLCGDSRRLTTLFERYSIGSIVTSPAYGNRMADSYDGRDGSRRSTYRIALGRPLTDGNGAGLHFGDDYRELHRVVWREAFAVLRTGGELVVNVSDFIRNGDVVPVVEWHRETILAIGFELVETMTIPTRRMGHGANRELRVPGERLLRFRKPDPVERPTLFGFTEPTRNGAAMDPRSDR